MKKWLIEKIRTLKELAEDLGSAGIIDNALAGKIIEFCESGYETEEEPREKFDSFIHTLVQKLEYTQTQGTSEIRRGIGVKAKDVPISNIIDALMALESRPPVAATADSSRDLEMQATTAGRARANAGTTSFLLKKKASLNIFLCLLCVRALMPVVAYIAGNKEAKSQGENHNHELAASASALMAGGLNMVLGWMLSSAQNEWWKTQNSIVDNAYARGENRYGQIKAGLVGLSTAVVFNIGLHHLIANGFKSDVTPTAAGLTNFASAFVWFKLIEFMVNSKTLNPVTAFKENAVPEEEFQRPGCCSR